jgi:hypothetical protein
MRGNESLGDTWELSAGQWQAANAPVAPLARYAHALAYDALRGQTVLFGGQGWTSSRVIHQDTWSWDGLRWNRFAPANQPPARSRHAMVFDWRNGRVVLFGGWDLQANVMNDTWLWNGIDWTLANPPNRPPARVKHAMAYDFQRGRVVLFGGTNIQNEFDDTWEWDGTDWTQATPTVIPPGRVLHSMAYDLRRGVTVLFGGVNRVAGEVDDTWEWDGRTWRHAQPFVKPPPRSDHAMAFHAGLGAVVLHGGWSSGKGQFADVWEWNGTIWSAQAFGPARYDHDLAYDLQRGRMVLFGGLDQAAAGFFGDVWEFHGPYPASYATFGSGCAGSAGTPSLAAAFGSLPFLGGSFTLRLGALPPAGNAAVVLLGRSRTLWGPTPLPLRLAAAGAPGCDLLVSPDFLLPVVNTGGTAQLVLPLCDCASLLGAVFYNQAFVVDPTANALGLSWSNGGAGTIGLR